MAVAHKLQTSVDMGKTWTDHAHSKIEYYRKPFKHGMLLIRIGAVDMEPRPENNSVCLVRTLDEDGTPTPRKPLKVECYTYPSKRVTLMDAQMLKQS